MRVSARWRQSVHMDALLIPCRRCGKEITVATMIFLMPNDLAAAVLGRIAREHRCVPGLEDGPELLTEVGT